MGFFYCMMYNRGILSHTCHQTIYRKICVLENEFGEVSIDDGLGTLLLQYCGVVIASFSLFWLFFLFSHY